MARRADWKHQTESVLKIRRAFARGVRRVLFVLPTGGGKTTVACRTIQKERKSKRRVLILVDSRELVHQWFATLVKLGFDESELGTILSGDERANPSAPIQIATIQTLTRRLKSRPKADLVLVDEAHIAAADTYRRVAKLYAKSLFLGLTATPWRLDGQGLRDAFDEMICGPSTIDLISEGILERPDVYTVSKDMVTELVKGVRVVKGDYDKGELGRRCSTRKIVGDTVKHWLRHGVGVATVVYAVTVAHGHKLASAFKTGMRQSKLKVAVEELYGNTPKSKREEILRRMESGERMIVVTVAVLIKGWDCLPAKCCVMARPTRSLTLWLQILGRFLRPYRGIRPVILDHAGNAHSLGLPQQAREWSLDGHKGKGRGSKGGDSFIRYCSECGHANELHQETCVKCGTTLIVEREPEQVEGKLEKLGPTPEEKAAILAAIEKVANDRGFPKAWVKKVFAARLGEAA